MKISISNPLETVQQFQEALVQPIGNYRFEVTRHNGGREYFQRKNIVVKVGLDYLAARAISNTASTMNYIAVGTVTAAHSLNSTNFGEVGRKAASIVASSNEVVILVNTWGGSADSVTSLALGSAATANHASSGQGTYLSMVNGLSTTLANSDFLKIQVECRVGSHG